MYVLHIRKPVGTERKSEEKDKTEESKNFSFKVLPPTFLQCSSSKLFGPICGVVMRNYLSGQLKRLTMFLGFPKKKLESCYT